MIFSVFTPLLTTTLNLNLSTISVRLECAAFSFPGIAWVLNFIAPSFLPTSFASCNSVGIQPEFLSSAQLRVRGGEAELAVGRSRLRGFFLGGVYSSPFPPTRHVSNLPPPLAPSPPALFSGPRIFSPGGPIQVLATPLQSSCCPLHYIKNCFFFWSTFFDYFTLWLRLMAEIPRRLQQVSTIATRKRIITWMVQDESIHGLPGLYNCTIHAFPEHFQGQRSSNLMRALQPIWRTKTASSKGSTRSWSQTL